MAAREALMCGNLGFRLPRALSETMSVSASVCSRKPSSGRPVMPAGSRGGGSFDGSFIAEYFSGRLDSSYTNITKTRQHFSHIKPHPRTARTC